MCGACVAKVTQSLNDSVGEANWKVDLLNPNKILTVTTDDLKEDEIITLIKNNGYKAEAILQ